MKIAETIDILQPKPMREIIFEYLRAAIIEGKLAPNERLVEKEYAQFFQTSRTPVREALRKLEMEGFVEYIPRKGMIVKSLSESEIKEIFSIRKALEVLAAKEAVKRITNEEIEYLSKLLLEAEEALLKNNLEVFVEKNKVFNMLLIKASKMPKLIYFIDLMKSSLARLRRVNFAGERRRNEVLAEHKMILQAIIEKDEDNVQRLVIEHLENAEKTYFKYYYQK